MVLDLGSGSLFRNQGLPQDSGRLSERWGQDGSDVVNIIITLGTDGTAYTVTAGKRLYVPSLFLADQATSASGVLRDGGAAGTVKFSYFRGSTAGTESVSFPTPLYFDTDVYFDETGGSTAGDITLTGWEEDLP